MWPFGGKRSGRTVAEQRVDNTKAIAAIANKIHQLQTKVVQIERNAPYERNNNKRKHLDIEKLRIERQIEQLERQHHSLSNRNKG